MFVRRCSQSAMIGAEIGGVSLGDDLSEEVVSQIRSALLEHHVLVIRGQNLTPREQLRFARRLGRVAPPEPSRGLTTHEDRYPEVQWLSYLRPDGSPPPDPRPSQADVWHIDYAYLPHHPEISFLYGAEIPENGPDTLFLDMQRAFDALPPERQEFLASLEGRHTQRGPLDPRAYRLPPYVVDGAPPVEELSADRGTTHPLVRTHPVSGRRALFLTQCYTTGFSGVEPSVSATIIADLYRHAEQPQFRYRHIWQGGDCLISDNTTTNHRRSKPLDGPRVLSRVMIAYEMT
jgi:taurine dioxygenase